METKFIIAVTEHHSFGHLVLPYLAEQSIERPYLSISQRLRLHDLTNSDYQFSQLESQIIKLSEKCSDEYLARKFNKKGTLNDFYKNIKDPVFNQKITPFISETIVRSLDLLKGTGIPIYYKKARYTNIYDEDLIELCYEDTEAIFNFHRVENETRYFLTIRHGDKRLSLLHRNIIILVNDPCRVLYQNKLYFFDNISGSKLAPFFDKEYITIPRNVEEKYYSTFVLNSIRSQQINYSGFEIITTIPQKESLLSLEIDIGGYPVFIFSFLYNSEPIKGKDEGKKVVHLIKQDDNYVFYCYNRDQIWEEKIIGLLNNSGINGPSYALKLEDDSNTDPSNALYQAITWLSKHYSELTKGGIKISQEQLDQKYFTGTQELDLQITHSNDWFDIHAVVRFGEFNIPFTRFRKNILNGIREFKLPNGEIAILPKEWFTHYYDIFSFGKTEELNLRLQDHHFTLLSEIANETDIRVKEKIKVLNEQKIASQHLPDNLQAKLRNYQKEGYDWLYHLYLNGLGGCLADDMGLGKTIQALTILLKLKRVETHKPYFQYDHAGQLSLFADNDFSDKTPQPASLIVVPVSLIHNWEKEIEKFAPSLKAFAYKGVRRERNAFDEIIFNYDIVLTTYGTVRNDADILSQYNFFFLILDESQYIKNAESKTYQTITELHAQYRLVLTGTPIENSLSDLWSQMNFLNRGLLGGLNFFKRQFINPIERAKDTQTSAKLQMLIRPFILRRTKEEVAGDLPPLTEESFVIEMSREQYELYETEKSSVRNLLMSNIEGVGIEKSTFIVIQALTRLRQIAIHPKLIDPESAIESGKFNEILSMMRILVAENHKILLFSSFVKHLNLLIREIEKEQWDYSLLTGKTTNRKKVIEEFQNDPDKKIFLISLKAGGVGLNLTAADYIFITDPWWNPAAEMQAVSRAHRIGQDKKVFVYRFISENTVEEKIQQLQVKKSALAEEFISSNDPFKGWGKDEILNLFE
jgi:SNF2 family DNA or RNA helicase